MKLIEILMDVIPKVGGWPKNADILIQNENGWIINPKPPIWPICKAFHADDWEMEAVTKGEYETALSASQQPAWSGEGLPPVGVTCEHCPGGTTQNEWEVVTVLGVSERPGGVFTDYWLRKEDGSTYIIGNPYRFRPIRPAAERKREEFAKGLCDYLDDLTEWDSPVGKVHARAIYDAIAAGKIPGVKLDDL